MGVPVVTMNSGGMAELVEDGKTGFLIPEATPEAFAQTLRKCMDDTYYQEILENCQQKSQSIMGVEAYCDIVLEKYNDLITKG